MYLADNGERFPSNDKGIDWTYYSWGGKEGLVAVEGAVVDSQFRMLNPYITKTGAVTTNEGERPSYSSARATMGPSMAPGPRISTQQSLTPTAAATSTIAAPTTTMATKGCFTRRAQMFEALVG